MSLVLYFGLSYVESHHANYIWCCICCYLTIFFVPMAAPLGSLIGNQLSCRVAVILGGFLASTGMVLSSFATSLEYLYLSLGVLTGKTP